jgi:outer membrane protein OmpA-like peptidoglycan-associated protein
MRKLFFALLVQLLLFTNAFSQSQIRKLPSIINHPSLNVIAPYISADGNALMFVSDGGQDGALIVSYTSREKDWAAPVELPKHLNNRLNFLKGYALSGDGRKMFVTSAKSPVIGGYDIMYSELRGNTWSTPVNLMLPINSISNEGCPSITPDGTTLYFMRCEKMDQAKAESCKLFSATKKSNGQWGEPVELPSSINTGNSQTPRILADGQTLIFSSDKMGAGKGGMDLYLTRNQNGIWSNPVSLDFANTERDDQYVSVSANGRYLLKDAKGNRNNYELTEYLFPGDLRPRGLTKFEGTIAGLEGRAVPSYISVTDLQSGKRVYSTKTPADGSYFFYLPEGTQYELSIDPDQAELTFYSRLIDLQTEKIPQKEKLNVTLRQPAAGDEIPLDLVTFQPNTADLSGLSSQELKRMARLMKANPAQTFEWQVTLNGFRQDSIQSPDLTEMKVDSVTIAADTVLQQPEHKIARITYHNDLTLRQAETINNFLNKEGVKPGQLTFVVNTIESTEPSRVTVKAVVR